MWPDPTKPVQALSDLGRSCVPTYPTGCGCCLHGGRTLLGYTLADSDLRYLQVSAVKTLIAAALGPVTATATPDQVRTAVRDLATAIAAL